jgi:hypothetical protein
MSSLLKDLQKMVEDVVWVFGGFGRQSAHINGCVSSTSQQFSMKFSMGCTFRYLWLSSYVFIVPIRTILPEELPRKAEQQSESWLVQNLIFSQSSFWGAILITQASPNILKLCISGGGLWRSSVQKIGGSVYIIRFSNSESQSLSATCEPWKSVLTDT